MGTYYYTTILLLKRAESVRRLWLKQFYTIRSAAHGY